MENKVPLRFLLNVFKISTSQIDYDFPVTVVPLNEKLKTEKKK